MLRKPGEGIDPGCRQPCNSKRAENTSRAEEGEGKVGRLLEADEYGGRAARDCQRGCHCQPR